MAVANITYDQSTPDLMFKSTESTFRTSAQAREYVYEMYMKGAPDAEVDRVMSLYPDG